MRQNQAECIRDNAKELQLCPIIVINPTAEAQRGQNYGLSSDLQLTCRYLTRRECDATVRHGRLPVSHKSQQKRDIFHIGCGIIYLPKKTSQQATMNIYQKRRHSKPPISQQIRNNSKWPSGCSVIHNAKYVIRNAKNVTANYLLRN